MAVEMIRRLVPHWPLGILLLLNVALSLAFSLVNPLYESTDELHNYRYIRYILATGKLPELDPDLPRIQAHHPPLYYLLGAAATFWIPHDTPWHYEPVWNPFWGFHPWEVGADNKNHYLHGPEESFPTRGTPLAARVARWVNVILGALTVLVTYAIARCILPDQTALTLGATAMVAFNPQFLYLSGAVNNDVAAGLMGAAIVLACIVQVNRPLTDRSAALFGVLLGVALNVKFNLVFMLIPVELTLAIAAWHNRSWRQWLMAHLVLIAIVLALAGWWFVRNQVLYGEPTAIRRTNELWGGRDPSRSWGTALIEVPYAWSSLWGRFGYGQIPMPDWIYTALGIVLAAASLGWGVAGIRSVLSRSDFRGRAAEPGSAALALQILVLFVVVVVFAGMLFGYMLVSTAGPMGRFFFPALPALAVLMVMGLAWLLPRRYQVALAACVAVAMLTLALYALIGILAPAYARPAALTAQQMEAIPHQLDVSFDGKARLLGYRVDTDMVRPGGQLAVTLYWRALEPMNENYAVFVHLVNSAGALSAQRDTWPGLGNFPTSLWKPGDTFADTYRVDIGETTYTPDEALVRVGLYRLDGPRLPVFSADGQPMGDGVVLLPVRIVPRPGDFPNAIRVNFGDQMALLGYDMNARAVRAGETISVTLYWRALAPMPVDYSVYMHLTSVEDNTIIVKNDGFPYTSPKRTRRWSPGQMMQEVRALAVPLYATPGLYDIDMGVFSEERGMLLPIVAPDGHYLGDSLKLVQVRVEK